MGFRNKMKVVGSVFRIRMKNCEIKFKRYL